MQGEILGTAPQLTTSIEPVGYGHAGVPYSREMGILRYPWRDRDPDQPGFMQLDPIFPFSGSNGRVYALNNSPLYVDPSGLQIPIPIEPLPLPIPGSLVPTNFPQPLFDPSQFGPNPLDNATFPPDLSFLGGPNSCPNPSKTDLPDFSNTFSKQDKKLSDGEIDKLKDAGIDPHSLKPRKNASKYDLFKDKDGNIIVKPKDGSGPGEPTGHNINDLGDTE